MSTLKTVALRFWSKVDKSGSKARFASKLTVEQVREIRFLLSTGTLQRIIAEEYDVSPTTISMIARDAAWKGLQ